MALRAQGLHAAFVEALGAQAVLRTGAMATKPLEIDLRLPLPPRIRLYMYSLVGGIGTVRPDEYKSNLRVPGQPTNEFWAFDQSGQRLVAVVGYRADLDVFVLWDPALHRKFTNGTNVQVKAEVVLAAAAGDTQYQVRRVAGGHELVIACAPSGLAEALVTRSRYLGSLSEEERRRFAL